MKEAKPIERKIALKRKTALKKAAKPLNKKSKKMRTNDRIYTVLRRDYLADHPVCEVVRPGCTGVSDQIHHKSGRGCNHNEVDTWLAVCDNCHKWIEANPAEAKALGYSDTRITNPVKKYFGKSKE